jgi:adenylate cyclase
MAVWLGIMGLRSTGNLEFLELVAYDWHIRLRPETSTAAARMALIGITERDIRAQGRWPLPDATLAQVLATLAQYQPRAIGLDIYRDVQVPPGHERLHQVFTSNPHIVVTKKIGGNGAEEIPPPPALEDTEQVGFNDILIDPGGVVRRGLLFLDDGETTAYAFALRLALLYLQAEGIFPQPDPANSQYIRLGRTTIRRFEGHDGGYVGTDARGYQFLLDFQDAPDALPAFSLSTLLAGKITPAALRDKIVLVGVTAESVKDVFFTPYSRGPYADQYTTGVVLHAHIIGQLLRSALEGDASIRTVSEGYEWGWILLWSVLGGLVGLAVRSPWRFSWLAAGGLLFLVLTTYGAFTRGWWLPVVPPALTWMTSATVVTAYMSNQEKRQRTLVMQLFSRYVSQEIAASIWQQRDQIIEQGRPRSQRMIVSVFFTDLVGFTAVSEKIAPQELMSWLSEYMEAMTPHVIDHQGVILRYIGDAIMAIFGVPLARTTEAEIRQDAVHAVHCALAMEQTLLQLNQRWYERQLPMIGMRVGIFTGPVVAGSIGSVQRLEYNVYGDTVNTAARLESYDKRNFIPDFLHAPCRILIGESTLRYLNGQCLTQRVGEVKLKGKEQKVTVYRVIGHQNKGLQAVE